MQAPQFTPGILMVASILIAPTARAGVLAEVSVGAGQRLHFLGADRGGARDILMIEESAHGSSAIDHVKTILGREGTEAEVFWALSERGTPVPDALWRPGLDEREQGWARASTRSEVAAAPPIACDNQTFTSSIAGGFLSNSPFMRLDRTPATYNAFSPYEHIVNGGPLPAPLYYYEATFNNIRQWRGKVCVRHVSGFSRYLTVAFEWFNPGLGWWDTMRSQGRESRWSIPENQIRVYTWAWNSNTPTNFRIVIDGAEANDEFDIMMDRRP